MYETFDFPYFTEHTEYQDSARALKLGGGWDYVVEPVVPDPRLFNVNLKALVWYCDIVDGREVVNINVNPDLNAGRLDAFYARHRLFKPFYFNHPKYGVVKVRFNEPLKLGEPTKNGGGVVENVQLKLIEVQ